MAVSGTLTYETKIDKSGFEKGLNNLTSSTGSAFSQIKSIIAALGIDKLISATFNALSESVSTAITRLDTLNNYGKVMQNLGASAEDADKSLTTLSDGLDGLPTSLNDAASSVQRLMASNGDVNKATSYYLAMNDAMLAGGTAAETQSAAMEQFLQMYSKGKVSSQEWISVLTAMPAQLQQVATSFGYTSTAVGGDFYTALQDGKISMDEFMDRMVLLDTEGTDSITSFAQQAKDATGGIATSFTNLKTRLAKGMADIIDSINTALKNAGLGSIADIVDEIGTKAKNVLSETAKYIGKVDLKSVFKWLQKLKPIIVAIVSALVSYQVVTKGIVAINFAKSIASLITEFISLVPLIKSAKDVMIAFNAVTSANPIGLVVTAIGALIGVLAVLATTESDAEKAASDLADQTAETKQSFDEFNASVDETMNADLAQIDNVTRLKDELLTLVDANGQVKAGNESRVSFILNEMNNALGTEYKLNGNLIEGYQQLQQEIDKLIEKKRAEIILSAEEQKYSEAIENEKTGMQEMSAALDQLGMSYEDAKKDIENYWAGQNELIIYGTTLTAEHADAVNKYTDSEIKAMEDKCTAYENGESKVEESLENQKQYEENFALFTEEKYDEIGKSVINSVQSYTDTSTQELKDNINTQQTELERFKTIYEQTGSEVAKTAMENAQQNITNLANELVARTSTIGALGKTEIEAWKTLGTQSYEQYVQALNSVNDGIDGTLAKEIQDATGIVVSDTSLASATGSEGSDATSSFGNNTNLSGIMKEKLNLTASTVNSDSSVQSSASNLGGKANSGWSESTNGWQWGWDLVSNISSGLSGSSAISLISSAAGRVASAISTYLKHSVPKKGPLKDELTYMPDMIDNLVKGIDSNKDKVAKASEGIADSLRSGFDLDALNDEIITKMNNAVALETGTINATASVKSNNSSLNVIKATFNIDGSVNMDAQKVGRVVTPSVTKTLKVGGYR